MTQTISINKNNDIFLDDLGNISFSYDLQAVLEICREVARARLGEMVFNVDLGIPFFETVWNGVPNIPQFTNALRNAFLSVPDVIEVVSLTTTQINDVLQYTAIIRTSFGTGTLNG